MGTGQAGVANGSREQIDRFASFAERYVIERASHFRLGHEKEDAWLALQDAKRVYGMIQRSVAMRNGAQEGTTRDAAMGQLAPPPIAYGTMPPHEMILHMQALSSQGITAPPELKKAFLIAMKGQPYGPSIPWKYAAPKATR